VFSTKIYSFPYFRALAVIEIAKNTALSLQEILDLQLRDILFDNRTLYLFLIDEIFDVTNTFLVFWDMRQKYFSSNDLIFTTVEGSRLRPAKFSKHLKSLLHACGAPDSPIHPRELSDLQISIIKEHQFTYHRQDIQPALSFILLGFYGLRPSEVAKLTAGDFDFGHMTMKLNNTKSNKNGESLPLVEPVASYLRTYIQHLDYHDPLFLKVSGSAWQRKTVTEALKELAADAGVDGPIHARKIRASFGKVLADLNLAPHIAADLMRHKDPATWLRHYAQVHKKEARKAYESTVSHFLLEMVQDENENVQA